VNYASLATARAAARAHEVGVRKAIGAKPADVLAQHLVESSVLTSAALVVAVLFVRALSPVVRAAWGIDLSLALSGELQFVAFILAVAIAVTLLAGAYPAFVLSRVQPIFALRTFRQGARRRMLLSVLVGIQFAAASFLSIAVAVIYLQNAELRRSGLGIAGDPLLVIEHRRELTGLSPATLRDELMRVPGVIAATAATEKPLSNSDAVPLARSADEGAPERMVPVYWVSQDFASVFDLELLAGRFPEPERAGDGEPRIARDIVIDRSLAEFFGFARPADAVDAVVYVPKSFVTSFGLGTTAQPRRVIGVVEDKPLAIYGGVHRGAVYRSGAEFPFTIVRIARDDVTGTVEETGFGGVLFPASP
jgi:putative ABC transport system permease protein